MTPAVSKEIQEIHTGTGSKKAEHRVAFTSSRAASGGENQGTTTTSTTSTIVGETPSFSGVGGGGGGAGAAPEVSRVGWGRWYTLRELEVATNGLGEENVIGEGGYGIVYKGVLGDGTRAAIKNLLNNRYLLLNSLVIPEFMFVSLSVCLVFLL